MLREQNLNTSSDSHSDFFEVSAKTGMNLHEALEEVVSRALGYSFRRVVIFPTNM